jgi:hypothetical protein
LPKKYWPVLMAPHAVQVPLLAAPQPERVWPAMGHVWHAVYVHVSVTPPEVVQYEFAGKPVHEVQ